MQNMQVKGPLSGQVLSYRYLLNILILITEQLHIGLVFTGDGVSIEVIQALITYCSEYQKVESSSMELELEESEHFHFIQMPFETPLL